jgi:hypothetical protein
MGLMAEPRESLLHYNCPLPLLHLPTDPESIKEQEKKKTVNGEPFKFSDRDASQHQTMDLLQMPCHVHYAVIYKCNSM